ncbi:hypothetical protein M404DRAFT_992334 [Pisolithus tinctorius Marx 270]|uniref:Uncharacterized protein n=1 Tax=Pisolithus tinctorius Marx 270 TaxID=870435 RepID=A0A0C3JY67_PISTI|nr:hypothetical protein M404DRAFT_992334 [Pisolithus tinctorius Marx 270]
MSSPEARINTFIFPSSIRNFHSSPSFPPPSPAMVADRLSGLLPASTASKSFSKPLGRGQKLGLSRCAVRPGTPFRRAVHEC